MFDIPTPPKSPKSGLWYLYSSIFFDRKFKSQIFSCKFAEENLEEAIQVVESCDDKVEDSKEEIPEITIILEEDNKLNESKVFEIALSTNLAIF